MANRPMRPCKAIGCPELVIDGYCDTHRRTTYKRQRDERPSWYRLYECKRWRDQRLIYLMDNPLCVVCAKDGRITPANTIDHIIDHKGCYDLFWDVSNWQSTCASCHSKKTVNDNPFSKG